MNQKKKQKNKNPIIGGRKFKEETFMTNDKLKQIIFILVATVVILFTTLAVVLTNHRTKQPVPQPKIIIITDTITNVVFDTIYIDHYKTVKLPVTDTLYRDSVKIDSIFVEVPISVYQLDTTFTTDTTNLNIRIQNSGYSVTLDTLAYKFTYQPAPPVIKKKRHRFGIFVGPSIGVGYDFLNNKPVPTVGIGVGIGWTMKKY